MKKLSSVSSDDVRTLQQAQLYARKLRDEIARHNHRYYVLNDPVISDASYDHLISLLRQIEMKWPSTITKTSPTQKIGDAVSGHFPEAKHLVPMLSLDNSYDEKDIDNFDRRIKNVLKKDKIGYAVEPKLDGIGISVIYEHDRLIRGATRGDGVTGEDITDNLKVVKGIPLQANFSKYNIGKVEVRGEVLMKKRSFKKLNKLRSDGGLPLFANPRNAAAGSVRQKSAKAVAKRDLEAWFYQIACAFDNDGREMTKEVGTQAHAIEIIHSAGLQSPCRQLKCFTSAAGITHAYHEWSVNREEFPFEIDGVVIKVNDLIAYKKLGFTSHHPRWAMALKFEPHQGTTKLVDVQFHVGRSGFVAPVGKLEPVHVGGVTISSVSLHNEDFIREKDIHINDTLIVERAGDVIPYVVKSVTHNRSARGAAVVFPARCPACHARLSRATGEAAWRCFNINCPSQVKERIRHFVFAMEIDGLGEKNIERFYNEKLLRSVADIYTMDFKKVFALKGFAARSIEKLKQSIEQSKHRSLHQLIDALGIPLVGPNTARALAEQVDSLDVLMHLTKQALKIFSGAGGKVSESVFAFFRKTENKVVIQELKKAGVNMQSEKTTRHGKLDGRTFVFTGELSHYTRSEAQRLIENLGGKVKDTVTRNVNYLVMGKRPGSKRERAAAKHVVILNEQQFAKLMNQKRAKASE